MKEKVDFKMNVHSSYKPAISLLSTYQNISVKHKDLYVSVHGSSIHNHQKLETIKMSINWWMDNKLQDIYNGVVLSNKKEQFSILPTVVVITQLYILVRNHKTIHLKLVNVIVCKLYLNKATFKYKQI